MSEAESPTDDRPEIETIREQDGLTFQEADPIQPGRWAWIEEPVDAEP